MEISHCYVGLSECKYPNLSPPKASPTGDNTRPATIGTSPCKQTDCWWLHMVNPSTKKLLAKRLILGFWFHVCCYWGNGEMGQTTNTFFMPCLLHFSAGFQHFNNWWTYIHSQKKTTLANPSSKLQTIICLWLVMLVSSHHAILQLALFDIQTWCLWWITHRSELWKSKIISKSQGFRSNPLHQNESQIPKINSNHSHRKRTFFKHQFFDVWFVLAEMQR